MISRYMQFLQQRRYSFRYAINGLKHVCKQEANFRIHIVSVLLAVSMGLILEIRQIEWCIIFLCAGCVLTMEVVNTGIERLCDIVHPGQHPGIQIIKDVMAAAVLIAAIVSFIIGSFIFVPYFF